MSSRRVSEPSPLRTGIVHAFLSLAVFGTFAAAFGAGIHMTADPDDAAPRARIALFEPEPAGRHAAAQIQDAQLVARAQRIGIPTPPPEAPDETEAAQSESERLALAYTPLENAGLRIDITGGQGGPAAGPQGIRINGQVVQPGQSLSGVRGAPGARAAPQAASLVAPSPVASPPRDIPAERFARPFSNPEGRPAVALVIGGLGINARQTQAAIDELPPEVTLAFAPDARGLDRWVRQARAKGHEVLIEVPMEAYEYGRLNMHPDTLVAGRDLSGNTARLERVLSRTNGFFGVMNYQGAKFAADEAAVSAMMSAVAARGLAFVDDGSLSRASFANSAAESGVHFVRASAPIDTRQAVDDIVAELMELETLALEHGAAMGSGFAFPVTLAAVTLWISQLEAKGFALAPVSALISEPQTVAPARVSDRALRTGSRSQAGLNPGR
jgi:polysaccharide deacetylase 2 family uncharacterized protein YibQ